MLLLPKAYSKKKMAYQGVRKSDEFNMNVYELMNEFGYDFNDHHL